MKTAILLSSVMLICISITSCKKTISSNSSNQSINQSLLYGKWNVVSDSSTVIQSSSSPSFGNSITYYVSIGLTAGGIQYETFLQNGQYINAGPLGGYSVPFSDTTIWKFINNNQIVIGTANYFNGSLEDTQDSVTITYLDAHNLSYKSIVHEYNSPDSIYIDYINDDR